jgi:hypothetical protein
MGLYENWKAMQGLSAAARAAMMARRVGMKSRLNLDDSSYITGETAPSAPTAPTTPSAPSAPDRGGGLSGLSAALQGAGYATQANVGPVYSGQEFKAGLLRGITGAGMVAAGLAAEKARQAEKAMKYDIKKEDPAEWDRQQAVKQKYALERISKGAEAAVNRAQQIGALERAYKGTDAEMRAIKGQSYDDAKEEAFKSGIDVTDNPFWIRDKGDEIYAWRLGLKGLESVKR